MRSSETTSSPAIAVAAPVSPVRPPEGTIATRSLEHSRAIAWTCSLVRGSAIAPGITGHPPLQRSLP